MLAAVVVLLARPAAAQELHQLRRLEDHSQTFEVFPTAGRYTVGDTVHVRFRLRLDERDLLFDTLPRAVPPLDGVRVLRVDRLQRNPDRIFEGTATIAFYRPGHRPVPVFALPFMRAVKGIQRGAVASDSAFVDVAAILPLGGPTLKDIREIEPAAGVGPGPIVTGVAILLILGLWLMLRRRRAAPVVPAPALAVVPRQFIPRPTAYELAVGRLAELGTRRLAERGEVERHYQGAADILRDYLESAEEFPARQRTTTETVWGLPAPLAERGLRESAQALFGDADLVKFARVRPDVRAAARFLTAARELLERWNDAQPSSQPVITEADLARPEEYADAAR